MSDTDTKLTILVVDDQKVQRVILNKKLKGLGYQVMEAADGYEALDVIKANPVDMVISDWMMDGMNGVDLCQALRNDDNTTYLYFILMSSRNDREDILSGLGAGADDFLRKPIDIDELTVRVRSGRRLIELQAALKQRNELLNAALNQINLDIDSAAELQRYLLPTEDLNSEKVNASWLFLPSGRVSGDALNIFQLTDDLIAFFNLDVAGHGIASGMLGMFMTQSLDPRSLGCVLLERDDSGNPIVMQPGQALEKLNNQMTRFGLGAGYLTCTYGLLNTSNGHVQYARAGHTLPLVLDRNGNAAPANEEGGMPIGLFEDAQYQDAECWLQAGSRLVLYSDGVTECPSPDNEEFGEERLTGYLADGKDASISELTQGLKQTINDWRGDSNANLLDDVSMLIIEFLDQPELASKPTNRRNSNAFAIR